MIEFTGLPKRLLEQAVAGSIWIEEHSPIALRYMESIAREHTKDPERQGWIVAVLLAAAHKSQGKCMICGHTMSQMQISLTFANEAALQHIRSDLPELEFIACIACEACSEEEAVIQAFYFLTTWSRMRAGQETKKRITN